MRNFLLDGIETPSGEGSTPLGGEALVRRKHQLQRAQADLNHFFATLEALEERQESSAPTIFDAFLDAYMSLHLDPLLRSEWQSRHPELAAIDASLRIAEAEIYWQLRDRRRVEAVVAEIERLYRGRENMLVEHRLGKRTTLREAVEGLVAGKWRG